MSSILYGKGVWAWMESEIPRAVDLAQAIGARIVLFKTGQGGEYLSPSPRVAERISDAGLIPCAWPVITCQDPEAEADVAIQSILDGYAGLVFDIEAPASGRRAEATRLGEIMAETELPQEVMFFTSMPNISAHRDIPCLEMSRFCRGGFMPQAYATFGWTPEYTLDVITYREFDLWTEEHQVDLPMYPVLGLYRDEQGADRLSVAEARLWLETLARHQPTFFSVYRAGVVPREVWPLLAEFETRPRGRKPRKAPTVAGLYVTVQPGDTMAQLCAAHGCTLGQFFAWNGHLWDARGKPRDPRLMAVGWIVRVA